MEQTTEQSLGYSSSFTDYEVKNVGGTRAKVKRSLKSKVTQLRKFHGNLPTILYDVVLDILARYWSPEGRRQVVHITEIIKDVLASGFVPDGDSDNMRRTETIQCAQRSRLTVGESNLRLFSPKEWPEEHAFCSNVQMFKLNQLHFPFPLKGVVQLKIRATNGLQSYSVCPN